MKFNKYRIILLPTDEKIKSQEKKGGFQGDMFSGAFNSPEDIHLKNSYKVNDCGENLTREIPETRIILHADVDSFEFQLWAREKRPKLVEKNSPIVVVNHDNIILAINAAGKRLGISRKKDESTGENALKAARRICRSKGVDLEVIMTGERFGRSDNFAPIRASDEILHSFIRFCKVHFPTAVIERASRDDFYLDITKEVSRRVDYQREFGGTLVPPFLHVLMLGAFRKKHTDPTCIEDPFVVMETEKGSISGSELGMRILGTYRQPDKIPSPDYHAHEIRLIYGALIADELRRWVHHETGFVLSFGTASNKLQAKLACSLNKPESCTIMTPHGFQRLCRTKYTIQNISGFGGENGEIIQKELERFHRMFDVKISRAATTPLSILERMCKNYAEAKPGKSAKEVAIDLLNKCKGIDETPVTGKIHTKFITVSATFKWPRNWIKFQVFVLGLAMDFKERLEYFKIEQTFMMVKIAMELEENYSEMPIQANEVENQLKIQEPFDHKEIYKFALGFIRSKAIHVNRILKVKFYCRRQ